MKKLLCLVLALFILIPQAAFAAAAPKLTVPSNFKATAPNYNTVRLTWSAVKGANGYLLYYKSGNKFVSLRSVSATSYVDTDSIQEQTAYSYKVRAYTTSSGKKVYSDLSAAVTVTTPSSLSMNIENMSNSSNKLTWGSYDGAAGYDIYRSQSAEGTYQFIGTTKALKYNDIGLSPNTTYYYKVKYYTMQNGKKSPAGFSIVLSAKTLPAGKSYLVVCFVGNSFTYIPETDTQFEKLCNETGKCVKVYHDMLGGSNLWNHMDNYDLGYFEDERKLADIVIYQEMGGWGVSADTISRINTYYPAKSKKYFMTTDPMTLDDIKHLNTYDIPGLTTFKTTFLFYSLVQEKNSRLFYAEDGWHPGVMWGYACASLIYCTFFNADPMKLPSDFVDPATIPGKTDKEKADFIAYLKNCVKWALAQ